MTQQCRHGGGGHQEDDQEVVELGQEPRQGPLDAPRRQTVRTMRCQAALGLRRIEPAQGAPGPLERLFGRHGVPRGRLGRELGRSGGGPARVVPGRA